MQQGRIFKKGHSWFVGYNVKEDRGGTVKWVSRIKKIAPFNDEYRSAASVRHLAQEILGPLNSKQARPEPTQTVADFIELVYLPHCKASLRPSTHFGYCHLFKLVKTHLATVRIRDFGPVETQTMGWS